MSREEVKYMYGRKPVTKDTKYTNQNLEFVRKAINSIFGEQPIKNLLSEGYNRCIEILIEGKSNDHEFCTNLRNMSENLTTLFENVKFTGNVQFVQQGHNRCLIKINYSDQSSNYDINYFNDVYHDNDDDDDDDYDDYGNYVPEEMVNYRKMGQKNVKETALQATVPRNLSSKRAPSIRGVKNPKNTLRLLLKFIFWFFITLIFFYKLSAIF